MQNIDAGYLYDLGAVLRPVRSLGSVESQPAWRWLSVLTAARDAIQMFVTGSIYREALRSSPHYADAVLQLMDPLIERLRGGEFDEKGVPFAQFYPLLQAFEKFEPIMVSELQAASIFYVPPRGGFDTRILIEDGVRLFPDTILGKAPETEVDLRQAARCMAFNLPTAAGFHLHRANEAVLRRYFDHEAGAKNRPSALSMGVLLGALKRLKKGDQRIIAALDNIKEFHRNPLMHPEHSLADTNEAISLYCAVRSAMSYMLEVLPLDFTPINARGVPADPLTAALATE